MRILWNNEFDKYTALFSSERTGFPATNVQHEHLTRVWRSLTDEDEYVAIDAGAGETVTADCAFLAAHNLSATAVVKIQGCDDGTYATPDVDETMTWDDGIMVAFFTSDALRFWRFLIDDPDNADGYIEIGRVAIGSYLQMPPIEPGIDLPMGTTTLLSESISGQAFSDIGTVYYNPTFAFPLITQAERASIETMWRAIEQHSPVFLVVWEDSLTVQGPIYCRINQDYLPWQKAGEAGLMWSVRVEFKEAF
ncbi:MAG: hypothetical protein ABFE01_05990 [Phycisphaerales bacterium]